MRFRFCGDLDCPDWVLAEISILSKLTSIKMRQLCGQVMKDLIGGNIDYEKVYKVTADAKFEDSDVKAAVAVLCFIFSSAAKYDVGDDSLSNELQQLGLPNENVTSLCKVYSENMGKLQGVLREKSLRISKFAGVEWRVDYVLSSSYVKDVDMPLVHMRLKTASQTGAEGGQEEEVITFSTTGRKFQTLLSELKQAKATLDNLA